MTAPRLAMVAGEASGDMLAGLLLHGLRERWPDLSAHGIGGPRMIEQGFEAWWPSQKLAITGYLEVLSHYRELSGMRNQLIDRLVKAPPAERADLFIGVDAPDFNLDLELKLRSQGLRTVHFVSPSIWAWRGQRVEKIKRAAELVLCLFPFEPAIYAKHGVPAAYVGHPLADKIPLEVPRAQARAALGIAADETVVALLPGSRKNEVQYIAAPMLKAAVLMAQERPGLRFVMPIVPGLRHAIEPLRRQHAPKLQIELLDGRSHDALAACDVTLIASGTATLEAALYKRPMVITYSVHALNWQMMKRMNYQPWVGLPNILLKDFAVPELLQGNATPERLAHATLAWLDDPQRCQVLFQRLDALHRSLRCNTAQRATDEIAKVLGRA